MSPMRATCPAHHIFLDLTKLIIFREQHRSFCSSLRGLLQSPVTSPPLSPKSSSAPYSRKSLDYISPWMLETNLYAHTKQQAKLQFCMCWYDMTNLETKVNPFNYLVNFTKHKNSLPMSQYTHCVSVAKTIQIMKFSAMVDVCRKS
jgi:hypothetical protein